MMSEAYEMEPAPELQRPSQPPPSAPPEPGFHTLPGTHGPGKRRVIRLAPPPSTTPNATEIIKVLRYRWQLALVLGAAAAVVMAILTWVFVPKTKMLYTTTALIHL